MDSPERFFNLFLWQYRFVPEDKTFSVALSRWFRDLWQWVGFMATHWFAEIFAIAKSLIRAALSWGLPAKTLEL